MKIRGSKLKSPGLILTKNAIYLIAFACIFTLVGCTFSIAPLPDDSLPAKVSVLETRVSNLEIPTATPPMQVLPQSNESEKKMLEIRGIDQAGQVKAVLFETDQLLSFSSLNNSSFTDLATSLPPETSLEYALLYSGEGTDWHLYYTQPPTEIVTVTEVATYRESTVNMASLQVGPVFSVSDSSAIQSISSSVINWQDSILQMQGAMDPAPPGRIFPQATAFLLVSQETPSGSIRTLIVFWGIHADGSEVAPGGIADLYAACDNCVSCYFWCSIIR